jgi:ubiquinone/menaquinone biosynthesis C-methylase UbiE
MGNTTSFFTDGQAYERLMGRWSRTAGEVFIDWLSLPKGLNWLDVGCGTGAFTELVIDRCRP